MSHPRVKESNSELKQFLALQRIHRSQGANNKEKHVLKGPLREKYGGNKA